MSIFPSYPELPPDTPRVGLPADDLLDLQNAAFPPQQGSFEEHSKAMDRRHFLRLGAGAAAVGGLLYAGVQFDTAVGNVMEGGGKPRIIAAEDLEAEKIFQNHRFVISIGGFGQNTRATAQALWPSLRNFGQVAYLQNSNSGLQIDAAKTVTLDFLKEHGAEEAIIFGDSMGGMVGTEIGAHLIANGVRLAAHGVDCTPTGRYDLRPSARLGAEALAQYNRITEDLDANGGPAMRFASESFSSSYQDLLNNERIDIKAVVKDALRKLQPSPSIASDALLEDEATYICSFDGASYGRAFPGGTPVLRLAPKDYSADQTVNDGTALIGFRDLVLPQCAVYDVRIPHGGHANPVQQPSEYNRMLTAALIDLVDRPRFAPMLRSH